MIFLFVRWLILYSVDAAINCHCCWLVLVIADYFQLGLPAVEPENTGLKIKKYGHGTELQHRRTRRWRQWGEGEGVFPSPVNWGVWERSRAEPSRNWIWWNLNSKEAIWWHLVHWIFCHISVVVCHISVVVVQLCRWLWVKEAVIVRVWCSHGEKKDWVHAHVCPAWNRV